MRLSTLNLDPASLGAIVQHSQLTRLWLLQCNTDSSPLRGLPTARPALPNLESLFVGYDRYGGAQQMLYALASPRLTYLGLVACISELPSCLTAFTALAALNASANTDPVRQSRLRGLDRLAALVPSLTQLDLSHCNLNELPPVFSTLTGLQRLVNECARLSLRAACVPLTRVCYSMSSHITPFHLCLAGAALQS